MNAAVGATLGLLIAFYIYVLTSIASGNSNFAIMEEIQALQTQVASLSETPTP